MNDGDLGIPDLRVWTGDPARPWTTGLWIERGRVAAGPTATRSPGFPGGAVAVPGFVDAHLHLTLGAEQRLELDLGHVDSRAAFEAAVARRHAELPPGAWLRAAGWSETRWSDRAMPDKTWLAAAHDRPVVCYRCDRHAAVVNDEVLRRCDLDAERPGWGGRIGRDAVTGEPTGLMVEAAAWELVNPLIPPWDRARRAEAVDDAVAHLHALGVTAVGTMEYRDAVEDVLLVAPPGGPRRLRMQVTLLDRGEAGLVAAARAIRGDDWVRVIGMKAFLDGTLGSRTARMLEPYTDAPETCGLWLELMTDGGLNAWLREVIDADLSPSLHAIGDAAVRAALDAFDAVDAPRTGPARVRLEHAQQVDPGDVRRFAGLIASMQPVHAVDDGVIIVDRLGQARLDGFFPFRRLADAGARLAFGSDWPIATCDPLQAIRAAVTGVLADGSVLRPERVLSVEEALAAHTAGAASALGLTDAGVLRAGAAGDVTVLDRDPRTADWVHAPPRVLATVVGGEVVWRR